MRLVTVPEPPEFSATCLVCGHDIPTGEKVADLDGTPYKAYYHRQCWVKVEIVNPDCPNQRTYWATVDDDGRMYYQVTPGWSPSAHGGGYYDLNALKALKGDAGQCHY